MEIKEHLYIRLFIPWLLRIARDRMSNCRDEIGIGIKEERQYARHPFPAK